MDLVLHIGCEKTGTKSIQTWLDQNSAALQSRGVFYSKALGRPNNRRIYLYAIELGRPDEGLLAEGVHNADQHAALQKKIEEELAAEVALAKRRNCHTFIISNEHLQSRCMRDDNVTKLHSLFKPLFTKMTIYCFVRPQMDTCVSLTSTMARNGLEVSRKWVNDMIKSAVLYFDMALLMKRWADVFGRVNVVPIPFKRNPDVVAYLEQRLGLMNPRLPRPQSVNEALDYRTIAICNAVQLRAFEGVDANHHRRFFVNEMPVEEKLTVDRASAQELQARFDASNQAFCNGWPQIQLSDMTPDWSRYPEVGNIDRVAILDEFGPYIRFIIERFNSESWFHQARINAAASERDAAAEKFESAVRFAEQARTQAKHASRHEFYAQKTERMIENLTVRIDRIRRRLEHRAPAAPEPAGAAQD